MRELAERLAEIHSVFSNEKRLLIFWGLDGREMSVGEIADYIDSSTQNTSQHLRLMKERSILTNRRDGQTIYYRVSESDVGKYCRQILWTSVGQYFYVPDIPELQEGCEQP